MERVRWTWAVSGAALLLAATLAIESQTHVMAVSAGMDWASRDRFPCPGVTGSLTALPLFTAMGARMERSPAPSVVMLGDSTFTSSPGCGQGELPAEHTFHSRLRSELAGTDILNFGLWAADWPVLSRQTALLRVAQETLPQGRKWVVLTNLPLPIGHLHPVFFAQACHHRTCDRICRALCAEEAESRSEGAWPFFRYFPFLAEPIAGMASFVQTFVTAAPLLPRPLQGAERLGFRALMAERSVTRLHELEASRGLDPERVARWRAEGEASFPRALELLRAGWSEGGLLQLWFREWLRQLRGLHGEVIFVSQLPNPDYLEKAPPEGRELAARIRGWIDRESLRAIPDAKLVTLALPGDAYFDMVHWTPKGADLAARAVAQAIVSAPSSLEKPR